MFGNLKQHLIKHKIRYVLGFIFVVWFYFLLPSKLFDKPYTTVLLGQNNELLGATIADDGQWRFPKSDSIPYKYEQCVLQFEDAYFYRHPGVNPISLFKAVYQDIKAGKIVRGGSTLTMQVARMARGNRPRNIYQKLLEIFWALRIELRFSKKEILNLYASHAPFGGNVVGLEAAAWRYYGRSPEKLSWGETATLAVLPNAPSLIYPGKNQKKLLRKRNLLLDKLRQKNIIDSITCTLAKAEKLPQKPNRLPAMAPHLLQKAIADGFKGKKIYSTININLQKQIQRIAKNHYHYLQANKIYNMGILVLRVDDGKVLAYLGNITQEKAKANQVDIVTAPRSTGSLLKPFLFAWAMKDGLILSNTLLKDTPTQIAGYHPKNYNKTYDGAVPAGEALARSLNIPAVRLLKNYGLQKFRDNLQDLHLSTINKPADYYGLTLILGGAETKLWEITGVYAGMARSLKRYNQGGKYFKNTYFMPDYSRINNDLNKIKKTGNSNMITDNPIFGAGNIWLVFKSLSQKDRPVEGGDWNIFQSAQKIAWKTGTSFGFRDAWSVGVTPQFVVGVWVGNATGEGRPGLTGTQVAAPIMFDVFKILPHSSWFEKPLEALKQAEVCSKSGYLAGPNCETTRWEYIPLNGERTRACPYHQIVHLNKEENLRVNSSCYPVAEMHTKKMFVLPPAQAWYYRKKHPDYKDIPPWAPGCQPDTEQNIALIYPNRNALIFLPKDFNNVQQKVVFKAAHQNLKATIYWYLDEDFIGSTQKKHQITIFIKQGKHKLTLVDDTGEMLTRKFEVVR